MTQNWPLARILGSARLYPGQKVTTDELRNRFTDEKDLARLKLGGVETRHIADKGTRAADVGTEVLRRALKDGGLDPLGLQRIIFVSSSGGDWIGTSTATAIIGNLGLAQRCDGFDLMNACTGFLSAMDLACRSVATGMGLVAVVVVELTTRFIEPTDSRSWAITGDAASAIIIGPSAQDDGGFLPIYLSNDFASGPTVGADNPALTQRFEHGRMKASLQAMTEMAIEGMRRGIEEGTRLAGISLGEVDWFVPHQPSPLLLDLLLSKFKIDRTKAISIAHQTGTIAAASIPACLDVLLRSGRVKPGQTVLMVSIGSPLVCGAAVYRARLLPRYAAA